MKKVKQIIASVKAFINRQFNSGVNKVFDLLKDNAGVIVNVVQAIKKFSDGPLDEILASVIPASAPIFATLRKIIPDVALKVAIGQKLVEASTDKETFLKNMATLLESISPEEREDFLTRFSAELLRRVSDGDFSWADFVYTTQILYAALKKESAI